MNDQDATIRGCQANVIYLTNSLMEIIELVRGLQAQLEIQADTLADLLQRRA